MPGLAMAPLQPVEKLHSAPSLMKFFVYAISTVVLFACILSAAYLYARRSRSSVLARLKEKSQKSGFEDIRFLAGDEDLDFNISHGRDVEEGEEVLEKKGNGEAKAKQETKSSKKDAKADIVRMAKQEDKKNLATHGRGEEDSNTDSDASTDDDGVGGGGAKRTHGKPNKKAYQKYVKHHDEDMASSLL